MKFSTAFILIACLHVNARGISQQLTLSEKNAPLQTVLKGIEAQSGYVFFYEKTVMRNAKPVTIQVKDAYLKDVLDICFRSQPLMYTIIGSTIVIKAKPKETSASPPLDPAIPAPLIPINISGRVVNENNEPVEGASVIVRGTSKGTSTNSNGEFELTGVDDNATLVISGVSIESFEVKVNGRSNLPVIKANTKMEVGQEVIINKGYYSTSKKLNTGNVSKVSSISIEKQPVSNPLQALQGRVSGIQITQATGNPGGGYAVLIRGRNNLRSGADYPLYVVDGVPYNTNPNLAELGYMITQGGNPLNLINPLDIESIEVLKDADATSIYGSRGANGVILITTKKGKAGTTKFNINFYKGYGEIGHKMELLNTQQYLQMRNEAIKNSNQPAGATDYDINGTWDKNRYTDWQEVLLGGQSEITNAQFSLSGGSGQTKFYFGGGYSSEGSVLPADFGDKKGSAHFNLNHGTDDGKFNVLFSASYLNDLNRLYSYDATSTALLLPPNAPQLFTPDGKLNWENDTWVNPLANMNETFKMLSNTLVANSKMFYRIVPEFQIGVSAGYTLTDIKETHLMPLSSIAPSYGYTSGESDFATDNTNTWIVEPQAEYRIKLGDGVITALAGMTLQKSNNERVSLHASGFSNDKLLQNIQAATKISTTNYLNNFYKYQAIYGRLNYEYKQKYIVNVTGRRDGSSRFGPGKQFGNFGAVGLAWILSNEKFLQSMPLISYAKLRGSYGTTGSDQTQDYGFLDLWNSTNYPYNGTQGLYPRSLYNPDLAWTLNKKLEVALELGAFKDRLHLSASFYNHKTPNQLISLALPSITGFQSILGNFPAVVENKGLEFELNSTNISKKRFQWTTGFNISFPKNKLVEFPGIENSAYATQYLVGRPLYTQFRYHYIGIDPNTGMAIYEDVNKDGAITVTDRTFNKEIAQEYYAGLENNITFNGFELNFLFNYVNQTAQGYKTFFYVQPGYKMNQPTVVLNRWQKPGDITDIQKFTSLVGDAAYTAYSRTADNKIVDASYLRLKSLRLAYQLPDKIIQKVKLQQCKFYLQGQNLLTFTNYIGLDPELVQGTFTSYYLPPLRVVTAGVQLNF